jgi:hypothetical protein
MTYSYYLGNKSFNVNIEENGKVNIDAEYVSTLEGIFASKDASVLYEIYDNNKVVNYNDFITNLDKLLNAKSALEKISSSGKSKQDSDSEYAAKLDKQKKSLTDKINAEIADKKRSIQSSFFNNLFKKGQIYSFTIPNTTIKSLKDTITSKEYINNSAGLTLQLQALIKDQNKAPPQPKAYDEEDSRFLRAKASNQIFYNDFKGELKAGEDPFGDKNKKSEILDPSSNKVISFIYLGDILNYAFGCLNTDKSTEFKHCFPVIGNFSYYDYEDGGDKEVNGVTIKTVKVKNRIPMNYCDLPISLERFKRFMFDEFVQKQVHTMRLDDFINRLFSKIVINSMDANLFGEQYKRSFGILATGQSNLKTVSNGSQQFEYITGHPYEEIIDRKISIENRKISDIGYKKQPEFSGKERLISYFYMFSKVSDNVTPQVVDYGSRDEFGVMNVNLATDRGVIKKVNFSKANIPYVAESAFVQNRAKSDSNPFLMQGVMNAEIEMFGNTYFKGGAMVYIDPSFMLKSPSASSLEVENFGLGGFYYITKVNHEISEGKFITKATAHFNHHNKVELNQLEPPISNPTSNSGLDNIAKIAQDVDEVIKSNKKLIGQK